MKHYCSIEKDFERNVVSLAAVLVSWHNARCVTTLKTAARKTKRNSNTVCISQGAIVIHEVYEDGAAAQDGRLWAGDQILEVSYPIISAFLQDLDVCSEVNVR